MYADTLKIPTLVDLYSYLWRQQASPGNCHTWQATVSHVKFRKEHTEQVHFNVGDHVKVKNVVVDIRRDKMTLNTTHDSQAEVMWLLLDVSVTSIDDSYYAMLSNYHYTWNYFRWLMYV